MNPNQDNNNIIIIQSAHDIVHSNAPGVDHSFTVTGNGQTSAGSDSHMIQPTNEHSSSSEAEIVQPSRSQSLSHTLQTTITIEIEER